MSASTVDTMYLLFPVLPSCSYDPTLASAYIVVTPELSDYVWAKKMWSLNTGGLLKCMVYSITTIGTQPSGP